MYVSTQHAQYSVIADSEVMCSTYMHTYICIYLYVHMYIPWR